ncbi:MAG: S1 RNA-binding domain-containing protein [Planctomycetes bacterium]|nr:S1 RNA-binding domain-containing protein [Planctomycetota bacterium]
MPAQTPAAPDGKVPLPHPNDDAELEDEVDAALGDVSLVDLYDLEEPVSKKKKPAETDPKAPPSSIKRGTVISIDGDDIFINLGGKSQGILPRDELETDETIEVGSEIDVVILRYDSKDGLLILSKKSAAEQVLWQNLEEGSLVEARVVGDNKGGLEMDIKGIPAFMPISQITFERVEDLKPFIGEKFICEVVEVERGDNNIVVSRRNVLIRERLEKERVLWEELDKGQTRHGIVQNLADYGAFIDLGGVEGLLHVSEMSWARVKHPSEILQIGQEIDIVIIEINKEKKRLSLSLKQAGGDPWTTVAQNYPVGSRHMVQVRNLQDFGAFAELEPGVEGLIPISEMTWTGRIRHPRDVVETGAMVEAEILSVDSEKRRLSMSMKRIEANPWENINQKYAPEQICTGKVARTADFGAFVTLEPGVDGLVHISELSEEHVKSTRSVVDVGDDVTVKIISIDRENQRIALTMKGLAPTEEPEPEAAEEPKKSKDRPKRGGLADSGKGWLDIGEIKM